MSALLMSSLSGVGLIIQVQTFGLLSTLRPPLKLFSAAPKPSVRWKVVAAFKGIPLAFITAPPEPEPGIQSPVLAFACKSPSIAKPPAGVPVSGVPVGGGGQELAESVKATLATKLEVWPTAVNSSAAPAASHVTNQLVCNLPLASAATSQGRWATLGSNDASKRSTWHSTCSPGRNPVPVLRAVSPGG